MTMRVKDAADLLKVVRSDLAEARKKVVVALAKDAQETIRQESDGQFAAQTRFVRDGFIVAEPKTSQDPDGSKAQELERRVQAYEKAYANLSNEAHGKAVADKALG